jgi:hypothetical protein
LFQILLKWTLYQKIFVKSPTFYDFLYFITSCDSLILLLFVKYAICLEDWINHLNVVIIFSLNFHIFWYITYSCQTNLLILSLWQFQDWLLLPTRKNFRFFEIFPWFLKSAFTIRLWWHCHNSIFPWFDLFKEHLDNKTFHQNQHFWFFSNLFNCFWFVWSCCILFLKIKFKLRHCIMIFKYCTFW